MKPHPPAPSRRRLLRCSTALAGLLAVAGADSALAQAQCVAGTGTSFTCSGTGTTGVNVSASGATVTAQPGFSVNSASGAYALQITGTGALSYTDTGNVSLAAPASTGNGLTITATGDAGSTFDTVGQILVNTAATLSGGNAGLYVQNGGSGSIGINGAAGSSFSGGTGIYATNTGTNAGDIVINAPNVTATVTGINVRQNGAQYVAISAGAEGSVSGGPNGYGVLAWVGPASTQGLGINGGAFSGGAYGIYAEYYGSGDARFESIGTVTATNGTGIYALAGPAAHSLVVNVNTVTAGVNGINVENRTTSGETDVTVMQSVTGGNIAIDAWNSSASPSTATLTVQTGGDAISPGINAIRARNTGSGDTGVYAYGNGTISGGMYGINAQNSGGGTVRVTTYGEVSGGSAAIYATAGGPAGPNKAIVIATNGTTHNSSGLASDLAVYGSGGPVTYTNSGTLTGRVLFNGTTNTLANSGTWNTAGGAGGNAETGLASVANSGTINFQQASGAYPFAAPISGTGNITQTGAGTTILTGANTHSGGTTINSGTLQLGAGGTTGSITGDVTDNGTLAFDRSDAVTFGGTISGSGSVSQTGGGTTTLTATNSYAGGTEVAAGTLAVATSSTTSTTNLGPGTVDIAAGGTLAAATGGAFTFANALTGTGRLTASNGGAAFDFASGAGSAFAGTVALSNDSFALGGTNTTALTNATLVVGTGNITTVADGNQHIGGLVISGGTMVFDVTAPADLVAASLVTTGTLDVSGTGAVRVAVPDPYVPPIQTIIPAGDPSLFAQSHVATGVRLVAATGTVTGDASGLTLRDQNGNAISNAQSVNINQGGTLVAIGTWDYGLGVGANHDGLYLGYDLTVIDIQPGQTLTLAETLGALGDDADVGAKITGTGDLVIAANNLVSLSNPTNDFTGTTTVRSGTLQAQAAGVIAASSAVTLAAGTTFDTNGFDQSLNNLTGAAGSSILVSGGDTLTLNVGAAPSDFVGTISGDGALVQAAGTQILSGASTYTGGTTIDAGATLQLGNGGASGSIAGDVTDNGTLAFDRSDEATLGGTITGTGGVSQIGSGATTLTGTNTYAGPTSVLAGTLYIDGDQSGAVGLTSVAAGATLGGIGIIGGSVTNAGTVAPGHAQPGTLTINGDYAGNGGMLLIRTVLGGDGSATDRLVVGGDTSGTTLVSVSNQGGSGAQTVNGIEIVRVAGASNGVFTLKSDYLFQGDPAVIAGAYAYRLYKNGVATPNDGGWYLRSTLTSGGGGGGGSDGGSGGGDSGGSGGGGNGGGDTGGGSGGGGGDSGGGDGGAGGGDTGDGGTTTPPQPPSGQQPTVPPLYQPGVPVYENYPQTLLALNTLPTLQQRVGNRNWAGGATTSGGVWGRMEGQRQRPDATLSTGLSDRRTDLWQAQIGLDRVLARRGDGATLIAGITAHYGKANSSVTSIFGDGAIRTNGYGLGATLTWYDPTGFYVDAQGRFSWYRSDLDSAPLGRLVDNNHGTGKAFSLELGKRAPLGGHLSLTPQVQMVYSRVGFDSFTDPHDADVRLGRADSLRTRWGLSLDRTTGSTHLYAITNLVYEWLDGTRVDVSGTPILNRDRRLTGEFGLGGSTALRGGRVVLYANASAATPLADFAHASTLSGVVGIRVGF